jgi:chaperonin cofactor prefoldin
MENNTSATPLIDLNQADVETLATLPGIGPALAARIVTFREEVHPFEETVEVTAVSGITEKMYRQFADQVTVSGSESEASSALAPEPKPPAAALTPQPEPQASPPPAGSLTPRRETVYPTTGPVGETAQDIPKSEGEAEAMTAQPPAGEPDHQLIPRRGSGVEANGEPETEEKSRPQSKEPPPVEPAVPALLGRGYWWRSCLLTVVAIAGGALLALLILQSINGTLDVTTHPRVLQLSDDLSALERQDETVNEEIQDLRNRLNQMEALSGRLQSAEADIQTLNKAIESLDEQIATLEGDTSEIQDAVDDIKTASDRFDGFLSGLRNLLQGIEAEGQAPTGTPLSPTETVPTPIPTVGPTLTTTGSPTSTSTLTPTPTHTPRPTPTATPTPTISPTPLSGRLPASGNIG